MRMADGHLRDTAVYSILDNEWPTIRRHLEALVAVGLVAAVEGTSDGYTPGRPATRFSLPPEISASVRALLSPYRPV